MSSDTGDPSEAAQLLNALEEVGLTGQRLAVSEGSEESLAKQIASYAGLIHKEWHVQFIRGQVISAVQMAELEGRANGDMADPGIQRIRDAGVAAEKERHSQADEKGDPQPVKVPRRGGLGKSVRLPGGRLVLDTEVESKVKRALLEELGVMRAPILEEIEKAMNPTRAAQAVMGKYRASTIRRYLASWQQFRKWFQTNARKGATPTGINLVDYLYVREEEGMGASIPVAISQAVNWFETLAGIPAEERMAAHPMVSNVVKELTKKLEEGAPPVKRAPRLLACFIPAMEYIVVDARSPTGRRICAWVKLVKTWASLRFSDIANVKSSHFRMVDGCLVGLLFKTKTTGAGKRIRELPIYVSSAAYVKYENWLAMGFSLVKDASSGLGPLVFGEGIFTETATGEVPMKYHEASAASGDLMEALCGADGRKLLPVGWERHWTEHSERSTLSSGLAALGIGKLERDLLGRWCPEGSDQYVRTYNAAVKRLQVKFSRAAGANNAYGRLDEGSALEDLKRWLVSHWGAGEDEADRAVEAWKKQIGGKRNQDDPGSDTDLASSGGEKEDLGKVVEARQPAFKRKLGALDKEREGGFVVVYRRAGRGTLHRLGSGACWMAKKRSFHKSEVYADPPNVECYSMKCKLCWPPAADESSGSTSDSCDEVELSDDEEGNVPLGGGDMKLMSILGAGFLCQPFRLKNLESDPEMIRQGFSGEWFESDSVVRDNME